MGIRVDNISLVCDSREQLAYQFKVPVACGTLGTGDYSIQGFEDKVAIERKTLDDLIGCLTIGRDRFERELIRGMDLEYFALVVETSLSDLANGNYRSKMTPKSAIQSLVAFSVRYKMPVWFAGNREYGQRLTESLLEKYLKEHG